MKQQTINHITLAVLIIIFICLNYSCTNKEKEPLPNILWLTSEDNSPFLGCYGDAFATTPNLDKLASEGFLYTHAYANAPVCAPARNTIITGVYANSGGNQQMRSFYKKSNEIRFSPQFLREAGYYCTNNSKEDYNIDRSQTTDIWSESSKSAHYKNRRSGQPFFAVFNCNISHESCIHKFIPTEKLRHDPNKVTLPPYHPDTPEMRHDWAQYYDKVEDMDTWVGKKLKELDDAGLTDNTIVFYYADHGGVLPRSKRFVYESGTHVPFIIRIPKKFKHLFPGKKPGSKIDRLISFVDLAPTLLSIAGVPIPEYMQGNAFLGEQKTVDPEYAYMFRGRMDERYDMCRSVRDHQFRYIRNYMPYRKYSQHVNYQWRAPSMQSWEDAYLSGTCNEIQSIFWNKKPLEELYDTENDPWEVNNLAKDPNYKEVLDRMRKANKDWVTKIYDTGFIPEAERNILAGDISFYDYMRSPSVSISAIMNAADLASLGEKENISQLLDFLKSENSVVRYWGATGLLILKDSAKPTIPDLKVAVNDSSRDVAVVAAEALYYLGEKELGINGLLNVLKHPDPYARTHALNALDYTEEQSQKITTAIIEMIERFAEDESRNRYDLRVVDWLFEKYNIDKSELKLDIPI
ncbi:sulfatase-like hydrolase/transferase [Sunxiuqinia sp. A32]|uniref:sulfatase-like hydrolase/transferase n=1 Tax=Sunxiuqinia sp. A32 TaxID=3461496 RepID=UPI004045F240